MKHILKVLTVESVKKLNEKRLTEDQLKEFEKTAKLFKYDFKNNFDKK